MRFLSNLDNYRTFPIHPKSQYPWTKICANHNYQRQVKMIFEIYPAENLWWLYTILVLGSIVMAFGYFLMVRESKNQVSGEKWVLKLRFILPFAAVGMLGACWMVYKQETATLEITEKALVVHAGGYSQVIARSRLRLEEAKLVDLEKDHPFQPVIRTNGTGAPTLRAGWFVLRNREKAFLLVTNTQRVLYLPTRDFVLMASLKNPEIFLKTFLVNERNH
jgi:hypothetical protein